jgi:GntR family transcriptional regulator, transcriptional repressor for pyruvate dehydrogenase complex
MEIQKIEKSTISNQVYEQLKENMISGTLKTGDKIPSENELAESFGVSRVSIRQALSKLMALGLIETRLGEGSFVRKIEPGIVLRDMIPHFYLNRESIKEVLEFRLIYEVEAASLAAKRIKEDEIEALKNKLDIMIENRDNIEKYSKVDLEYHLLVSKSTRNSFVIQLNYIMNEMLHATIKGLTLDVGSENGIMYHTLLLEALRAHDSEKSRKVMREHLEITLQNYINKTNIKK